MTARLIYFSTQSLDGYIEDEQGKLDWAAPDEERLLFINELVRPVGTYLNGRRMHETMQVWTDLGRSESDPAWMRDFGEMWRAADKIVYSKTMKQVSVPNTRLEHTFDPDRIREMKLQATRHMVMNGNDLAGQAFKADLVDEIMLFVVPVLLGGGKRSLSGGLRLELELADERRFQKSGIVYLHYRRRAA